MAVGRKPTRKQKELLKKYKLNPNNWLVFKNPTGKLHIMHRITRSKRVISY
jgi:hypothetical protein